MNQDIEKIRDIILRSVECEKLYLFGSHAYGTPGEESDYDFYVVVSDNGVRPSEATDVIYHALYKKTNKKPVDVLVKRASDFERRRSLPTLENEIARKGVLLYG